MSDQPDLQSQLAATLGQGVRLLGRLDAEVYGRSPEPLTKSPVGAHVRHALDCCLCFLDGAPAGRIDYDRRQREERTELDPTFARAQLETVVERFRSLGQQAETELDVRSDVPALTGDDECWRRSTVGRELLYVLSHTVHHYALIAMILRSFDVEPGEDFGVAPSTLRYWKESGRCAPLAG